MALLSAISITFFKVSAPLNPPPNLLFSKSTKVSMVGVFGESKASAAGVADESTAATLVTMASTLAAKPHLGQST